MKTSKKAATITTFILTIGLLIIGLVVIASLRKMTVYKASGIESEVLSSIVEQISRTADKASDYPTNAKYKLQINYAEEYKAKINNNYLTLNFTRRNKVVSKKLLPSKLYILPSTFSSSGEIFVYKDNNNLLITNNLTCNPGDGICDPGCVIKEICDPDCYSEKRDGVCNPYCLDKNRDGKVDASDSDGICDPDCYSNVYKGSYDIDCVKSNDNICDPATNGIKDGICDYDCIKTNGVCDPDCSGYDADCPHKDNGFCEPERGENCKNTKDCKCKSYQECRPNCKIKGIEEDGCINKSLLLTDGTFCDTSCECNSNNCIWGYCCEKGEYFSTAKTLPGCISFWDDGICNTTAPLYENCTSSPKDCNCTTRGLGDCCVGCAGSQIDEGGCCPTGEINCSNKCKEIPNPKYEEGHNCDCSQECDETKGLYCSASKSNPNDKACCPNDKVWDSVTKKCEESTCSYPCTPNCKLPKKWDWRNVNGVNYLNPVRDQDGCGGCWAFSTAGTIEGGYNVQKNRPASGLDLSEQYLVSDCFPPTQMDPTHVSPNNCNGGVTLFALNFVKQKGIVTESCVPYEAHNSACSKCPSWQNELYGIKDFKNVPSNSNDVKKALICEGPLSISIHKWRFFNGQWTGHAVVLVGYDDTKKEWIIRNSWGPGYSEGSESGGYGGLGYSSRKGLEVTDFPFYVINVEKR